MRSLSAAAHFSSVRRFLVTRLSNTVRPFATTFNRLYLLRAGERADRAGADRAIVAAIHHAAVQVKANLIASARRPAASAFGAAQNAAYAASIPAGEDA